MRRWKRRAEALGAVVRHLQRRRGAQHPRPAAPAGAAGNHPDARGPGRLPIASATIAWGGRSWSVMMCWHRPAAPRRRWRVRPVPSSTAAGGAGCSASPRPTWWCAGPISPSPSRAPHPQGRTRPLLQRRRPGPQPRGRTPPTPDLISTSSATCFAQAALIEGNRLENNLFGIYLHGARNALPPIGCNLRRATQGGQLCTPIGGQY